MRNMWIVFAFLFSSSVFALPALHDYASYDVTAIEKGGAPVVGVYELEIVDYNKESDKFGIKETITMSGRAPGVEQSWLSSSDLSVFADLGKLDQACQAAHGKLETLDVPAGQIEACAVTQENKEKTRTTWVGAVTFGVVQIEVVDKTSGDRLIMKLRSHRTEAQTASL